MAKREERAVPIAVPGADWVLEGLFNAGASEGSPGAIVAPPHPLYGGSMESPVVGEVAHALTQAGYGTMRFNWRGVGASGGQPSGEIDAARDDYAAAVQQVAETVSGPLVAAGYSFGAVAAVAAAANETRVRELVLVAPPPSMLERAAFRDDQRVLFLVGEHDMIAAPDATAALAESLPAARCIVIDQADHFFAAGLAVIGKEVARFAAALGGERP